MRNLRIVQGLLLACMVLLLFLIWRGSWYVPAVLCVVAALFSVGIGFQGQIRFKGQLPDRFKPRIHWRNDGMETD